MDHALHTMVGLARSEAHCKDLRPGIVWQEKSVQGQCVNIQRSNRGVSVRTTISLRLQTALLPLLLAGAPLLVAQEVSPATSQPLQPGDALSVSFSMEPALNGIYYVDEGGRVNLPILGSRSVGTVPPAELKQALVDEYDGQLRNQTVQITWLRRVVVFGAVNVPGLYHVDGTMTLADAIALAGGATPIGKLDGVQIVRNGQVIQDDLPASTLVGQQIYSGDQITVPERSWVSRYAGVLIGATLSAITLVLIATID